MNPLDPRDPKNLVAYQIFFGDDTEKRTPPSRNIGGCVSAGLALLVCAMILTLVVILAGH